MTTDRDSWDEYHLKMAHLVATRSKDPRSKVGAVIVSEENLVLSTGYNGLARGVLDLEERIDERDEKLRWIYHAESNAIVNAARLGIALKGSTIHVSKFPCVGCANAIVQAGIRRVHTDDAKTWKHDPTGDDGARSIRVFSEAGVILHAPNLPLGQAPESRPPVERANGQHII